MAAPRRCGCCARPPPHCNCAPAQPLPDQTVELRGDMSPLGIWRRTDAQGRAQVDLPLPGRWVLRGTDLRRSESVPDQFESRFFTLAFEVLPRDAPLRPAAP